MRPYKRRNYFIDKRMQGKFILLTILMLLFYTAALVLILFVPYILPLQFGAPVEEQISAARILLTLHKTVWPAVGIVILLAGILTIFVSHSVAGPVYRFRKAFAEVAAGNLDVVITLRKTDDLKDLAVEVNTFFKDWRELVQSLRGDQQALTACVQQLEEKLRTKDVDNAYGQELLVRLQESRSNLARALEKYSVKA